VGLAQPGKTTHAAWINSSLTISPKEQVDFIQKMIQGKLSISNYAIQMTKLIVFKEELAQGWKLFGKTGWSGSDITKDGKTLEHSWFVGWIEKDHHFYPFAYLIRDKKINLEQRVPRVKQLLMQSQIYGVDAVKKSHTNYGYQKHLDVLQNIEQILDERRGTERIYHFCSHVSPRVSPFDKRGKCVKYS
jgi:hypothetical protein